MFPILALCGCCVRRAELPHQLAEPKRANSIYIVSNGWHTGFVVPARQMERAVPELIHRFDRPAYYEIGWGDRDFYRAKKITASMGLKALFWAKGSILHVVAMRRAPKETFRFAELYSAKISDAEMQALITYMEDSFLRDANGQIVMLGRGIYSDSEFYDGSGRYSMFNTCNTWTARGLKSAGMKISPVFKLTAGSVMAAIRKAESGKKKVP